MRSGVLGLVLMAVLSGLAGCRGSVPPRTYTVCLSSRPCFDPKKDPYWEDGTWDKALLRSVQSSVHNPADPADTATPALHAVVKFTYLAGTVEYPEIVQSTGDSGKDELLLHQLASAQLPPATGIDSDKPHEFVLDLDMPTPFEAFRYSMFDAIDYAKVYPKDAIIEGMQGINSVDFDYTDGKAAGIRLTKSSGRKTLDRASLTAVTKAVMPEPPAAYAAKTFHIEVLFCYALGEDGVEAGHCPGGRNVILVEGTRIRRVDIQSVPADRGKR